MKRIFCILLACTLIFAVACAKPEAAAIDSVHDLTFYLNEAQRLISEGDYEEAILAYEAAIAIEPKDPDVYAGLAEAYISMNNTNKAIEVLEQGVSETGNSTLVALLEDILAGEALEREQRSQPEQAPSDIVVPNEMRDLFIRLEGAIALENPAEAITLILDVQASDFAKSHNLIKINDIVMHGEHQVYYFGWLSNGTGKFFEMNIDSSGGLICTMIDMVDYAFTGEYDFKRYLDAKLTNHRYGSILDGQMVLPYYEDFYGGIRDGVYVFSEEPHHVVFDQPWGPYPLDGGFMDMLKREAELENGYVR